MNKSEQFTVKVEFNKEKLREMIEEFKKNNPDFIWVVRCKDCKKWMDFSNYKGWENRGFCFLHEANNSSDDFCSYGERKEVSE